MHPSANSKPTSGILTIAESDLKKSQFKSSEFSTYKVILNPYLETSPPVLISLFL